MLTSHTVRMKSRISQYVITLVLVCTAGATWAGTILVAAHVSQIVLDTLDMIVELAALT